MDWDRRFSVFAVLGMFYMQFFFTVLGCRQIDLCYLANSVGANHANQHKNGGEEDLFKKYPGELERLI